MVGLVVFGNEAQCAVPASPHAHVPARVAERTKRGLFSPSECFCHRRRCKATRRFACRRRDIGLSTPDPAPPPSHSSSSVPLFPFRNQWFAQRRQMQHTIMTLEMQLLVKDIVDTACLRASERVSEKSSDRSSVRSNQSSLKVRLCMALCGLATRRLPCVLACVACVCEAVRRSSSRVSSSAPR